MNDHELADTEILRLTPRALGAYGEQVAARYLREMGWSILHTNFRCRWGEIDLIAREGHTLVFVEVKTRRSFSHGLGFEAITARKIRNARRAIGVFFEEHAPAHRDVRMDAIQVFLPPGHESTIEHMRGIS